MESTYLSYSGHGRVTESNGELIIVKETLDHKSVDNPPNFMFQTHVRKETQQSLLAKIPKYYIKAGNVIDIRGDIERIFNGDDDENIQVNTIQDIPNIPTEIMILSPRSNSKTLKIKTSIRVTIPYSTRQVTVTLFATQTISDLLAHLGEFNS